MTRIRLSIRQASDGREFITYTPADASLVADASFGWIVPGLENPQSEFIGYCCPIGFDVMPGQIITGLTVNTSGSCNVGYKDVRDTYPGAFEGRDFESFVVSFSDYNNLCTYIEAICNSRCPRIRTPSTMIENFAMEMEFLAYITDPAVRSELQPSDFVNIQGGVNCAFLGTRVLKERFAPFANNETEVSAAVHTFLQDIGCGKVPDSLNITQIEKEWIVSVVNVDTTLDTLYALYSLLYLCPGFGDIISKFGEFKDEGSQLIAQAAIAPVEARENMKALLNRLRH